MTLEAGDLVEIWNRNTGWLPAKFIEQRGDLFLVEITVSLVHTEIWSGTKHYIRKEHEPSISD